MKRSRVLFFLLVLAALVSATIVIAAETFTVTRVDPAGTDMSITKVYWKAASDGTKADGTIPDGYANGLVIAIITNPGSVAPADNYDLTILDKDGVDIAAGTLANRDTANSEIVQPLAGALAYPQGRPVVGPQTVTFTNQANANCDGEIIIFSLK